jgi:Flp pilus assembly protein TadG
MNTQTTIERFKNEKGQTMAEFAIVLPILATLLFSIIQFGFVLNNYLTLTDGVRAGARKASVSRGLPDPAGAAVAAVRSSAADLKQADLNVAVASPSWKRGDDVTVSADYPYSIKILGLVVQSGTLRSKTTERIE